MTLLIGLAIRSSVVLAGGLLMTACLTKHCAALRHRVLATTLLRVFASMPNPATLTTKRLADSYGGPDSPIETPRTHAASPLDAGAGVWRHARPGSSAGRAYVNGQPEDDSYVRPESRGAGGGPEIVPEGYYFVMGDRRNNSSDSRHWGYVPANYIVGSVTVRWWPMADARRF